MSVPAGVDAETGVVELEALSDDEAVEMEGHETVIGNGLRAFREVGEALMAIRDKRLYRDRFASFETYCESVWGMSRRHADRLAAAAEVAEILDDEAGPIGLTSESQARELARLKDQPDALREAYEEALEAAAGPPTAEGLREAVNRRISPKPKAAPKEETDEERRQRRAAEYEAKQQAQREQEVLAAAHQQILDNDARARAEAANGEVRKLIARLLEIDPVLAASACTDPDRRGRRLDSLAAWTQAHREALASDGASLHVIHGG